MIRIILSVITSLLIFGSLLFLLPLIFGSFIKKADSKIIPKVMVFSMGFLLSIFFNEITYFNSTAALLAPLFFILKGTLVDNDWSAVISFLAGWFGYLLFLYLMLTF